MLAACGTLINVRNMFASRPQAKHESRRKERSRAVTQQSKHVESGRRHGTAERNEELRQPAFTNHQSSLRTGKKTSLLCSGAYRTHDIFRNPPLLLRQSFALVLESPKLSSDSHKRNAGEDLCRMVPKRQLHPYMAGMLYARDSLDGTSDEAFACTVFAISAA